jgi:hypothetical protein
MWQGAYSGSSDPLEDTLVDVPTYPGTRIYQALSYRKVDLYPAWPCPPLATYVHTWSITLQPNQTTDAAICASYRGGVTPWEQDSNKDAADIYVTFRNNNSVPYKFRPWMIGSTGNEATDESLNRVTGWNGATTDGWLGVGNTFPGEEITSNTPYTASDARGLIGGTNARLIGKGK